MLVQRLRSSPLQQHFRKRCFVRARIYTKCAFSATPGAVFNHISRMHYCEGPDETASDDLYLRLGLTKAAKAEQIKQRFFELSKIHHPDAGGDADKFRRIKEGYEILSNPKKRRLYDIGILSPDGAVSRAKLFAQLAASFVLLMSVLKLISLLCGMRMRDIVLAYLCFAYIGSSSLVAKSGARGAMFTLLFCYASNVVWANAVDARIVRDSFTEESVDLIGPASAEATVSVYENKAKIFSTTVALQGVRSSVNVPLARSSGKDPREVRVLFEQSPYGFYRSTRTFALEPLL